MKWFSCLGYNDCKYPDKDKKCTPLASPPADNPLNLSSAPDLAVSCHHCHWTGKQSELKVIYIHGTDQGVELEPGCPVCFQLDELEYHD